MSNKQHIKGFFTGNPPKKLKWFFPILRTYGFNYWYNHTNNGQMVQWAIFGLTIIGVLLSFWILMSVFILADPSNGYYH